jgi:hypothetical protein
MQKNSKVKRIDRILSKALGIARTGIDPRATPQTRKPTLSKFSLREFDPEAEAPLYESVKNVSSGHSRSALERTRANHNESEDVVEARKVPHADVVRRKDEKMDTQAPIAVRPPSDWADEFLPHHFMSR